MLRGPIPCTVQRHISFPCYQTLSVDQDHFTALKYKIVIIVVNYLCITEYLGIHKNCQLALSAVYSFLFSAMFVDRFFNVLFRNRGPIFIGVKKLNYIAK